MSYSKEKTEIIKKIVINGNNIKSYKKPFIKSIKLFKEVNQYNNIIEWAGDQTEYYKLLSKFRNKTLIKS